jgi:hypothetical protein
MNSLFGIDTLVIYLVCIYIVIHIEIGNKENNFHVSFFEEKIFFKSPFLDKPFVFRLNHFQSPQVLSMDY